jgi:hypothetical protein
MRLTIDRQFLVRPGVRAIAVALLMSSFHAAPPALTADAVTLRQAPKPASPGDGPAFDAASVKRNNDPDGPRFFSTPGPGRVRLMADLSSTPRKRRQRSTSS